MNRLLLAALCALTTSSTSALAQFAANGAGPERLEIAGERSNWSEHALPGDFTSSSSATCLGTLVFIQTPTAVHLWSAITSKWTIVPVSASAQVTYFNAYAIITDGNTLHGYATRTGVVDTLSLSATPQLYSGANTSCWLSVAALGTDAWGFSAFDGVWRHHSLTNFPQHVEIEQTTAVLDDGTDVYGISAYYGNFVRSDVALPTTLGAAGDVGMAWSLTSTSGFSAHTNTWATVNGTSLNLLAIERGYFMLDDGSSLIAYSPCTGDFNSHPVPAGFNFVSGRYVCAAVSGSDVIVYSSGQNEFDEETFTGVPIVQVDDEVLAIQDDAGVTGFSVVNGSLSERLDGSFNVQLKDAMVWAEDGAQGHALCTLTGEWSQAPDYDSLSQSVVLRNCVVLVNPLGDYSACSGRTGEWIARATTTPLQFSAPGSGDMFAGFEGSTVHIYDPVTGRWATQGIAAPLVDSDIWRQTFVGFDGVVAHGFGLMNNRWSTVHPQGNFVRLDANSSAGMLLTDTHIYGYSAHGSLTTLSRFPEFSRLQPIDSPLRLLQTAAPGSSVVAILAERADYAPFKPYGTLFVKRSSIITRVQLGTVPQSGLIDFPLDVSGMTDMRGRALHVQCLVVPPFGTRYLTIAIAPVIL